jgi:HEPN domain-containing protein
MGNNLDDIENIRMPLFSWDYEDLGEADHWFLMAHAYFDCGFYLFTEMAKETFDRNYHRALVAVSIFNHSVELFLKAAIAQAGKTITSCHNLEQLYNQYKKLYPGKKYEFEAEISSVVRPHQNTPYNEFARYPTDHAGQPWPGYTHVDVAVWYERLSVFQKDFDRLEPLLKERYQEKNNPKLE